MLKKISFIVLGIVFVAFIGIALWWVFMKNQERLIPKESFIPDNSEIVIQFNKNVSLNSELKSALANEISRLEGGLLYKIIDTLKKEKLIESGSYFHAIKRGEKDEISSLYVFSRGGTLSRADVNSFINNAFSKQGVEQNKYEGNVVYSTGIVAFVLAGGMFLISDSESYLKEALSYSKKNVGSGMPSFKNMNRYFSSNSGLNIFVNKAFYSELLPLFVDNNIISKTNDISKWFEWGAFDADFKDKGISLNGFMNYNGSENAYPSVFAGQRVVECELDRVLPSTVKSAGLLALSDVKRYLDALENYRISNGLSDKINKRKKDFNTVFGLDVEKEWTEFLKGEWGKGVFNYDSSKKTEDGIVIVNVKSGSLTNSLIERMLTNYSKKRSSSLSSFKYNYQIDGDRVVEYYKMPESDFVTVMWGYIFDGIASNFVFVVDNYVVFASSQGALQNFIREYTRRQGLNEVEWFKKLRANMAYKFNWQYVCDFSEMSAFYSDHSKGKLNTFFKDNKDVLNVFTGLGMQWSSENDLLYSTVFLNTEAMQEKHAQILWQTKLDSEIITKPAIVTNHNTKEREIFVQDANENVYLINDVGRVLWKTPIQGRINSEIYQVDMYKNGKFQYLFSTPSHVYLIDRNGSYLPRYPLQLKSSCKQGITMCDYENNKDYRIFAPCDDHNIYLYELSGNLVKGWNTPKTDNDVVSKVRHFRIDGKDYIIFADKHRVYIMDRKGNERVKVNNLFNLEDVTYLHGARNSKNSFVVCFIDADGAFQMVDLNGKIEQLPIERDIKEGLINTADITGSGKNEIILCKDDTVFVYDFTGKELAKQEISNSQLDAPYVYRFSNSDRRIGVVDTKNDKVYLLNSKGVSKGFPINGAIPFSIAFYEQGSAGFYLFSGNRDGNLVKYRVQR